MVLLAQEESLCIQNIGNLIAKDHSLLVLPPNLPLLCLPKSFPPLQPEVRAYLGQEPPFLVDFTVQENLQGIFA